MLYLQEKMQKELVSILRDMGVDRDEVVLEISNSLENGDLTTNIAMQISKELGKSPRDIAQEIVSKINSSEDFSKIEVAGPGFINFFYSESALLNNIQKILEGPKEAFKLESRKGKNLIVEYTDPNPFKVLHIGHLYTNMVGEAFARLQEASGAHVMRAIYQGDIGLHVAKTMYGLKVLLDEKDLSFSDIASYSLSERVSFLGEAYMLGFKYYDDDENPEAIKFIREVNYYIFSMYIPSLEKKEYFKELEELGVKEWFYEGREWCMEYFEQIYKRTGTKFDYYFLESEIGESGLDIVLQNTDEKGKGVYKSDDGAIIYEGDPKKGLHTRVFVNKEGLPTYEAKEIGLAFAKREKIDYDESVVITADEQSGYFKVVLDSLSQLDTSLANATKHFPHGMVKLPGAEKMSSRKGKILGGEWLLDETRLKVESLMEENEKWSDEEIKKVSDKIAVGAVKYAFLKVSVGKDVIFDFDQATSFDGDTGPYLQYVYARCNSILGDNSVNHGSKPSVELDAYTQVLLRHIGKFESELLNSCENYSPSTLCTYLFELGQKFNAFYQNVRVLDSEDKEFLLTVVKATGETMSYGLNVLGIETVEKM